jgi:hypothetical protein
MLPVERPLWDYTFARQAFFPGAPLKAVPGPLSLASLTSAGAPVTVVTYAAPAGAIAGALAPAFGGDIYERLHFFPVALALGNVVGVQEREIRIWNAHFSARQLHAIDRTAAEGVLIAAGPVPAELQPLQELAWTVRVTQDGPPIIQATLTFRFDRLQAVPIPVTGNRVTAWIWLADWSEPVIERLHWLTDVLIAHDGSERRRALRAAPRRSYEFSYLASGAARRSLELLLHGWGARVWARPDWHAVTHLGAAASTGATSLTADGTSGFVVGGIALLHDGATRAELIEIAALSPSTITLTRALGQHWPAGTRLYPAHTARLAEAAELAHTTDTLSRGRVRFDDEAPASASTAHGLPSYRGAPLLTLRHNFSEGPDSHFERALSTLDNETGVRFSEDRFGRPATRQSRHFTLRSRAEAETWRRLLQALCGRQGALWLDSATDDLRVVSPISAIAVTLDVEWCGYTLYAQVQIGRRDLRIETSAGTFLRRVLASIELSGSIEQITLDAALGVSLSLTEIRRVSFLQPSRLDADAIEIAWETDTVAQSRAAFRMVPDVL